MTATARRPLNDFLSKLYPFTVLADPDGGYVVVFPDLPGCMTQVETLAELPAMAEDARRGWIETEYEQGHDIPLPSQPSECATYSGKFVVRLPRSLHRALVQAAARENVSLNQYVLALLSSGPRWAAGAMAEPFSVADSVVLHAPQRVNDSGAASGKRRRSSSPYRAGMLYTRRADGTARKPRDGRAKRGQMDG